MVTKCDECTEEFKHDIILWNGCIFCSYKCRDIYTKRLVQEHTEIRDNPSK